MLTRTALAWWLMVLVFAPVMAAMNRAFTAVIKQDDNWWIGWIQEIPGINSQGHTREELVSNLRSALREALEMNRAEALRQAEDAYEEEAIVLRVRPRVSFALAKSQTIFCSPPYPTP